MADQGTIARRLAGVLLLVAAFARADCTPSIAPVSTIGSVPNRMAAAVATNGFVAGLTKIDTAPGTNPIDFATYDSDFTQLTPDVTVAPASLNGPVALLWNGSEFGVFYQAPSLTLMFQRLDSSGSPIGSPVAIANHGWSSGDEFNVTWVPARNAYAIGRTVTVGPDYGIWLMLVSDSGAVQLDAPVPVSFDPPALPRIASLSDGTVGLAVARSGAVPSLTVAWFSPAGIFSSSVVENQTVTDVRVATNGNAMLIIDSVPTSTGGSTLRFAQVNVAGVITGDSPFLSGSGIDIAPSALVWNGSLSEWVLTYIDAPLGLRNFPGDTRIRRFASPTGLASDTLLSPDPTHSRLAAPYPPVFLNGGYIDSIAAAFPAAGGSESYLVRLCPFFVTATAAPPIQSRYAPITFSAEPSGGIAPYTYSWSFGDLTPAVIGSIVQHAFQYDGTYTVTLTGTDSAGAQSVYKFTVTVGSLRRRAVR